MKKEREEGKKNLKRRRQFAGWYDESSGNSNATTARLNANSFIDCNSKSRVSIILTTEFARWHSLNEKMEREKRNARISSAVIPTEDKSRSLTPFAADFVRFLYYKVNSRIVAPMFHSYHLSWDIMLKLGTDEVVDYSLRY